MSMAKIWQKWWASAWGQSKWTRNLPATSSCSFWSWSQVIHGRYCHQVYPKMIIMSYYIILPQMSPFLVNEPKWFVTVSWPHFHHFRSKWPPNLPHDLSIVPPKCPARPRLACVPAPICCCVPLPTTWRWPPGWVYPESPECSGGKMGEDHIW